MSNKDFRGVDSPVNSCMWDFQRFVARTNPYIAVFESVGPAFSTGRELMQRLRAQLEVDTGQQWNLFHVLHNNAAVGGAAIRKRYFWLVSRIPFGIELPEVERVPTLRESISDLEGLDALEFGMQPYAREATWWSKDRRTDTGWVDGHSQRQPFAPHHRRVLQLLERIDWPMKDNLGQTAKRYYELHGHLPPEWAGHQEENAIRKDFSFGYNQPIRWHYDKVGRVITGGALGTVVHPEEPRFLTHRECARIQGFPDDWRIEPNREQRAMEQWWGKGIPVDVGRWIGGWIDAALRGEPGTHLGEPDEHSGEREFVIQAGKGHYAVCKER